MAQDSNPPAAQIRPDELVDRRYRVHEQIGEGGFCTVFAAEHVGTGQAVALKVLHRVEEGGTARERFLREARVTASLRHPNTVRVFDVGETVGGALYLAMEMLRGPTLERALSERKAKGAVFGEAECIDLAVSILGSLDEAHRAGLVHRDLKPSNLVMCTAEDVGAPVDTLSQMHPKVLDFGIARTHDSSLTDDRSTLGTPAYMSPEQCLGRKVDQRSDLYSLAAVLWECVCGELLFIDDNPMTVMFGHAYHDPPDLAMHARVPLSDGFIAIMKKALLKHPSQRFATAAEMRHSLQSVVTVRTQHSRTALPEVQSPTDDMLAIPDAGQNNLQLAQTPQHGSELATRRNRDASDFSVVVQRELAAEDARDAIRNKRILLVGILISVAGILIFMFGQVVRSQSSPAIPPQPTSTPTMSAAPALPSTSAAKPATNVKEPGPTSP